MVEGQCRDLEAKETKSINFVPEEMKLEICDGVRTLWVESSFKNIGKTMIKIPLCPRISVEIKWTFLEVVIGSKLVYSADMIIVWVSDQDSADFRDFVSKRMGAVIDRWINQKTLACLGIKKIG